MSIRRLAALLLLCAPAACTPIVTHGPRAEPGLQLTATGGLGYPLCDIECETYLGNQNGIGLRYGRPAENGRAGYSVGGTLSLSVVSSDVDLYVQAPTAPAWAAGGGVLLSVMHVMPYVQLGRMRADGAGFYTTQGVVWMPGRSDGYGMDYSPRAEVKPIYWAPTVAYRLPYQRTAFNLYVSGALGTMTLRDVSSDPDVPPPPARAPIRFISAGITIEQGIGRRR